MGLAKGSGTSVPLVLPATGARLTSAAGAGTNGEIAFEPDGANSIASPFPTTWYGANPPERIRVSRAAVDGNGFQHAFFGPYEFGMGFGYGGVFEGFVGQFSIRNFLSNNPGKVTFRNYGDTGGLFFQGRETNSAGNGAEISTSLDDNATSDGPIFLRTPVATDGVWVTSGTTKGGGATKTAGLGAFGVGSTAALQLGADCVLYRASADIFRTVDTFQVAPSGNGIYCDKLTGYSNPWIQLGQGVGSGAAVLEFLEINSAPAAPAADRGRMYLIDNGSGKTQLMIIFSSGAAQQIAIQP